MKPVDRFPDEDTEGYVMQPLTRAHLFFWDKGLRVPADLAAILLSEGYDIEVAPSYCGKGALGCAWNR